MYLKILLGIPLHTILRILFSHSLIVRDSNVRLGSTKNAAKIIVFRYVNDVFLRRCSNNPRNLGSLVTMNANDRLNIPAVPPAAGFQLRVSCLSNVLAHKRFPQPRPLIFKTAECQP